MSTETWEGLEFLAGLDLTAEVPCQWPLDDGCEQPARHVMVQQHTRPPIPCLRVNLCDDHKAATIASEAEWLRQGAARSDARAVICTPHTRQVETLARWERL